MKEKEIIKLYNQNRNMREISKKYNTNRFMISNILKKNNIKIRNRSNYHKYKVNELFFENIDNEKKAYCLGIWYADGCNFAKENCIIISLKDLDVIKKIKKTMNFNGPITKIKEENYALLYKLTIYHKKLSQDLIKWGCVQRKTYCLNFPKNISEELMPHFIRGLFDGDGCICPVTKSKRWCVSITGTKDICNGLRNYLNYGYVYINRKNINNHHETYIWTTKGQREVKYFLDYIYNNAVIYMNRKFKKYQKFLRK